MSTINREDAIDAVYERIRQIGYEHDASVRSIMQAIRDLPSTQPEIIYCGECKHMLPNGRCLAFADLNIRPMASDYCSKAERRQDG